MIDRAEFAKVMGAFADRIGRALAPFTADVYYDLLSESLTTEEFLAAGRVVFKSHQFNTWPSVQQFVEAVKPKENARLAGAELFEKVLRAAGTVHDDPRLRTERVTALGPEVFRAFRAAGGLRDFTNVLEKELPFLRNRFVDAYEASVTSAEQHEEAAVALSAMDPAVGELVTGLAKRMTPAQPTGRDKALPTGDR